MLLPKAYLNPKEGAIPPKRVKLPSQRDFPRIHLVGDTEDVRTESLMSVFLPRKSNGQRSLAGYSPWDHEESDRTERLHFHFSLSCTAEGNGNPLLYSCLENPREGGAWWAAAYGVTQSPI